MPINSWTVLGEFLVIWSEKTWPKPVLQISCNQEGVLAQQIYFQEAWGCSYWQGGSSESSPNQAGLASGDQRRAYSTEQPKNKTETVEIQLHFVQLDYWGHPGSKLGVWNSCNEETVLKRSLSSRAWEQKRFISYFNNHIKEELALHCQSRGGEKDFSYGEDDGNMSKMCFPLLSGLKKGKIYIFLKIIISRTLLSHMLLAEVVNK